jgi:hypothetical protein
MLHLRDDPASKILLLGNTYNKTVVLTALSNSFGRFAEIGGAGAI